MGLSLFQCAHGCQPTLFPAPEKEFSCLSVQIFIHGCRNTWMGDSPTPFVVSSGPGRERVSNTWSTGRVKDLKRDPGFWLDTSWIPIIRNFHQQHPEQLTKTLADPGIPWCVASPAPPLDPSDKGDPSSEGEETSADNQEVISSLLTRSALEFQFTLLVFLLENYFLCFLPACLSCELRLSTKCSKCVLLFGSKPDP